MPGLPTSADASSIGAALRSVLDRIERACERSGRERASVRLIAVSKTVPVERIRALLAHGHRLLGENRVQEALQKMDLLGDAAAFHLVGHLQRNKARHAVGRFELIHSVDGDKLARELDRRAGAMGVRQPVLLQVNLAGEVTKAGVSEAELPRLLDVVAPLAQLELRVLMTIPPPVDKPEESRAWCVRLREVRDRAETRFGSALPELSMGMTDDFEVAVEEGATLVRVGRAIFGERSGQRQTSRQANRIGDSLHPADESPTGSDIG
jgi:pyridoxal phosphate enzyme (YggS family)